MYKRPSIKKSDIRKNESVEGETVEEMITRFKENNEPIGGDAPIIHTQRKDGVVAGYDPRSNRLEVALEMTDKLSMMHAARREGNMTVVKDENETGEQESVAGNGE